MTKVKNVLFILVGVAVIAIGILYITDVISISINWEKISAISSTSYYALGALKIFKGMRSES